MTRKYTIAAVSAAVLIAVAIALYALNLEARSFMQKSYTYAVTKIANPKMDVYVDDLIIDGDNVGEDYKLPRKVDNFIVEYRGQNLTGRHVFLMNVDNTLVAFLGTPNIMTRAFGNTAVLTFGQQYHFATLGWSETETYVNARGRELHYRDFMNVIPLNMPDRHITLSELTTADKMERRQVFFQEDGRFRFDDYTDGDSWSTFVQVESQIQLRVTTPPACSEGQAADSMIDTTASYTVYHVEYIDGKVFQLWLNKECK